MNDIEKEMDTLFAIYQRDRSLLEEKRADIIKLQKKIDENQDLSNESRRQMRQWFCKEVIKHCEEEGFLSAMEICEDEVNDSYRKIENELMDEKDRLEAEKQKTYAMEEELETEYKKKRNSLEVSYGISNESGNGSQSVG